MNNPRKNPDQNRNRNCNEPPQHRFTDKTIGTHYGGCVP
ncbi:MAG: hypothetical protein C5S47_01545 [Candidatus Methanogasteraceae archaeon]|nr:MAG: hypothetical protein C5S47_01545 [ANME-2 cluster archaeon]